MRIYKMTATFGKLEHEILTLEPGLNIITAPNEWGKSTWCAFLVAMLYGMDTRAKSTKSVLADKDRYAPWSGAPMSGRIDLNWQGRDITIERNTKKRVPLGEFKAYETESGLNVPELTAANCGQMLLGVEQTVFKRAGFIRHADLPVSQDEALRRRLNALVTTGDENGAADKLAAELKDLKNKVKYNKSGLLPQAEAELKLLDERLSELEMLDSQCKKLKMRLEEAKEWRVRLKNHEQALAYAEAEAVAARVAQAREKAEKAEEVLAKLEGDCHNLPQAEEAGRKLQEIRDLELQWNALALQQRFRPEEPEKPALGGVFFGKTLEQAKEELGRDREEYRHLLGAKGPKTMFLVGLVGVVCGLILLILRCVGPGVAAVAASVAAMVWGITARNASRKQAALLVKKYGGGPEGWGWAISEYERECQAYEVRMKEYRTVGDDVQQQMALLGKRREALCGGQEPEEMLAFWQQVLAKREALTEARREALGVRRHYEDLAAMGKRVDKPALEDGLSCNRQETEQLLRECGEELHRLQNRLGQYQGRMETLGDKGKLESQRQRKKERIAQLEQTLYALTVALETLAEARSELQRRFAPRIAKRAQELMGRMTEGRYHSLAMGEDFSLQAGAGEENVLHEALWRSDGTMDQLYLALRLAVAEELTPEAPLVLDDALVRFDDERMAAAVEILKEMAEGKQVILFSCQGREAEV